MKLNKQIFRSLIKEAVADRIKMIDEAGNIAALEAKIKKVDEDIQEAISVRNAISGMENLKHYTSPEIVGDLLDELANSVKELQKTKKELEDQKKQMSKPAKKGSNK